MKNTNKLASYIAGSCHEIGYKWLIDAPRALSAEDVEALQEALCGWTDAPNTYQMHQMLDSISDTELDAEKLPLYRQVSLHVECVHREAFTQDLISEESEAANANA